MIFSKYKISILAIVIVLMCGCTKNDGDFDPQPKNLQLDRQEGIINDELNGIPIVIYGNPDKNFFTVFERTSGDNEILEFEHSNIPFPNVFRDQHGNVWDVFGLQNKGIQTGERLTLVKNLVGYWFIFPAFNKKVLLNDNSEIINPNDIENNNGQWIIDDNNVFAGTFKDGIKSIDQPQYMDFNNKEIIDDEFYKVLDPNELITIIKVGKVFFAYPHKILEYHEVVNDKIGDLNIAISFCPLTGTSKVWDREINQGITEFGVSGLLYNNNLILYDRVSDSYWSQILDKSVSGPLIGEKAVSFQTWEIRYEDISNLEGKVKMLSTNTGIDYEYQYSLYGDYKYSDRINFPLTFSDDRIPPKERVLGVTVGGITKVYRFEDFDLE